MKPLAAIKSDLRQLIPESIADTIKALKELLPEDSERYQEALALEGRLNETNKNRLMGVITDEQLQLNYNRIRKDLLDLITSLEDSDFDESQAKTAKDKAKQAKRGNILYRIPGTMPLGKESKCIVRIAFDKETIIQNIDLDEHLQLKDIRISDIMQVELIDPSKDQPFQIRALNSPEQFIEEGEYTEWLFYVEPLREGIFPLMLKVSVIELIQGKERKREIVLEEQVQIVTEGSVEETAEPLQAAGYAFSFSSGSTMDIQYMDSEVPRSPSPGSPPKTRSIHSTHSPISPPSVPRRGKVLPRVAMMLALLIAFTGGVWAITPARVEWMAVRYLQDKEEAYDWFIARHEESSLRENAYMRKAEIQKTEAKKVEVFEAYLAAYPQTARFEESAKWQIAKLKNEPIPYLEYLEAFPEAKAAKKEGWTQATIAERVGESVQNQTDTTGLKRVLNLLPNLSDETVKEAIRKKAATLSPVIDNTTQPIEPKSEKTQSNPPKEETKSDLSNAVEVDVNTQPVENSLGDEPIEKTSSITKDLLTFDGKYGQIKDKEGHTYRTLPLNGQIWMADNLNLKVENSWCYGDDPVNCQQYGRLYNWEAAKKACAQLGNGWRLPTDNEWQQMAKLFGGVDEDSTDKGKATYRALINEGESGFAALLGGFRNRDGEYIYLGRYGDYWSATEYGADYAWSYWFNGDDQRLDRYNNLKSYALSCRCIQDN